MPNAITHERKTRSGRHRCRAGTRRSRPIFRDRTVNAKWVNGTVNAIGTETIGTKGNFVEPIRDRSRPSCQSDASPSVPNHARPLFAQCPVMSQTARPCVPQGPLATEWSRNVPTVPRRSPDGPGQSSGPNCVCKKMATPCGTFRTKSRRRPLVPRGPAWSHVLPRGANVGPHVSHIFGNFSHRPDWSQLVPISPMWSHAIPPHG